MDAQFLMHLDRPSLTRPFHSCRRALIGILGGVAIAFTTGAANGVVVDYNKSNDYYAARSAAPGRINIVDQYHLGPCQERFRERDYPRAMGECNFILKIFPNHPTALHLMAQVCEQWKSPKCMLDDYFEKAVAINPKAAPTFAIQGMHFHTVKQYSKAIQAYTYALGIDPDLLNAHYNLALSYVETRQFDLANKHAQRAYELGATLPGLRNRLEKEGQWKPVEKGSPEVPKETSAPARTVPPAGATGTK